MPDLYALSIKFTIRGNKTKVSNVRVLEEFNNLRSSLQQQITSIDYAHMYSKFLKSNDLKLKSNRVIHPNKSYHLLKEKRSTQNPENVIFNFSRYVLSDCEKYTFSIPCKKLDYADYLAHFELFFRDICNLDILSNEGLHFVKAKTKEAAISSYRSYNNNVPQNLSKEGFIALKNSLKIKT